MLPLSARFNPLVLARMRVRRAAVRIRPNAGAAELRLTMLVKREIIFRVFGISG